MKNINNISIVICCYNSQNRISPVLESILDLEKPRSTNFEVVVVNNNSVDNTSEILNSYTTSFKKNGINYSITFEKKAGLIFARKNGVQNSNYPYILFVDDDNILYPNYILNTIKILNTENNIGILGGYSLGNFQSPLPPWINPGIPFKSLLNSLAITTMSNNKVGNLGDSNDFIFGAGSIYRREIFIKLNQISYDLLLTGRKGDLLLSGEDEELCYLAKFMGYKIVRSNQLKFRHVITDNRINKNYFEKLYFGFGYSSVIIDIYRTLSFKDSFKYSFIYEIYSAKIKYLIFQTLYSILKVWDNKFFKLHLLGQFQKGKIAFLNSKGELKGLVASIKSIKLVLSNDN